MTTTMTQTVNGINLEALQQAIDAISGDAKNGQTHWEIHSRWVGGTRSDHHVTGYRIGETDVQRRFTIKSDEPLELCGTNEHPNPQEYLLSALNACMMVGYAAIAGMMGITLTRLEVTTTGDIDLRGFLGLDPNVANGYERLQQSVRIAGDGTEAQFRELHEKVKATSPNFFNVTRAVPVNSTMIVD